MFRDDGRSHDDWTARNALRCPVVRLVGAEPGINSDGIPLRVCVHLSLLLVFCSRFNHDAKAPIKHTGSLRLTEILVVRDHLFKSRDIVRNTHRVTTSFKFRDIVPHFVRLSRDNIS
jgi:hypothetical protein